VTDRRTYRRTGWNS